MGRMALLVIAAASSAFGLIPVAAASAVPGPMPKLEKGIDISYYDRTSWSDAFVALQAAGTASYVAELGANSVAIGIPLWMKAPTASKIFAGTDPLDPKILTPAAERVGAVVDAFHAAGIAVRLRPYLAEETLASFHRWRGSIEPIDRDRWFVSYRHALEPYLAAAETHGVESVAIAVELQSLKDDPRWEGLISWATRRYSGQLQWCSTWYQGADYYPSWSPTKLALDAYPSMEMPDSASVADLLTGWQGYLSAHPLPSWSSRVVLQEVGILPQAGMYAGPSKHSSTGRFRQRVQSRWFQAACRFRTVMGYRGIYFYALYFGGSLPSLDSPSPDKPWMLQPKGLKAIKACFAST